MRLTYTYDIVMKPGPTVRRTTLVENFSTQASLRIKNVVVLGTEKSWAGFGKGGTCILSKMK